MIAQITTLGYMQLEKIAYRSRYQGMSGKTYAPLAPYFERSSFIKEEASRQELNVFHDLGLTQMNEEDLLECKAALNVIGYDPVNKLVNLLADNNVLGFSRPGVDWHPHLNLLKSLLPKLKKESHATHLALAVPVSLQKLLDVFTLTGEILPTLSPINLADFGLSGENDFVALLKVARLTGLKLVAVQPNSSIGAFDPLYEINMAKNVQNILKSDTRAKIIFLAPDRHLGSASVGDWMPVARLLKEQNIGIATVAQYWQGNFMPKPLAWFFSGLIKPIALASKDVKKFAVMQKGVLALEEILSENWDMTIVYPKKSARKRNFLNSFIMQLSLLR